MVKATRRYKSVLLDWVQCLAVKMRWTNDLRACSKKFLCFYLNILNVTLSRFCTPDKEAREIEYMSLESSNQQKSEGGKNLKAIICTTAAGKQRGRKGLSIVAKNQGRKLQGLEQRAPVSENVVEESEQTE